MQVIKKNGLLIFLVLLLVASGVAGEYVPLAILPIVLYLLKRRNLYQELLLGFFIVLTLSDSRMDLLSWAANAKNEYIVMLSLFLFFDRKSFQPISHFYQRFVPFFIIAYVSIFFAPENIVLTSIQKTTSYLFLLIVVSNYVVKCHKLYGQEFFRNLIYMGVALLAMGFVLKVISPVNATLEGRFRGMFGNPNALGIYVLMMFLMFSLVKEVYPALFKRNETWFIYIALFASVLLSGSRNSLFAIGIFILFSYLYRISPYLGFFIFIVLLIVYQSIEANIADIVTNAGLGNYLRVKTLSDASGRFIAWNFAKDHIKESIWIGRGFEFTEDLFEGSAQWLNNLGHQGNAHNSYLTFWLDTGFIGLAFYVWAFLKSFIEAAKKSTLALPIMYAVIFSTIFESWLTASLNPFTIQLFIILTVLTSEAIYPSKTKVAVPLQ